MKKTDIAMIILIAAVCVVIAFFVTRSVMGGITSENVKVKTIESISPDIQEPSAEVFNSEAINPSVEVQIKPNDQ